ncbi:helix-turn-helix transcriptional regulator [Nostocales cyanobacterium LEGE 11386]|nr:helix-turn-helix transcriptional regulator [Nostocales cyanobacterium LEGE 11386]
MAKVITDEQFDEIEQETSDYSEVSHHIKGFDQIKKWKSCFIHGFYRIVQLRPGLSLEILDHVYYQQVNCQVNHYGFYDLTSKFYLSGNHGVICPGIPGIQDNYQEIAGNNYLFYLPDIEEIEQNLPGDRYHLIRICLDLNFLKDFCIGLEVLPRKLQLLVNNSTLQRFHLPVGEITPMMQTALWQLVNSPYQGIAQKMYLESKVLELLALQFTQLLEAEATQKIIVKLKNQDIESIYHAKEILIRNQAHPPTLLDLAQQVGIHHMKLKKGFRQIFGTTPFGYLHEYRMEQARQLLQAGNMSVTAVANAVGYDHLGHFSTAFKRKFGINPNSCRSGNKILAN